MNINQESKEPKNQIQKNREVKMNHNKEDNRSQFRKISKDKYIIAAVLTLMIFSLGFLMGIILEEERYNVAQELNNYQDIDYLSLQLQYLMLSSSTTVSSNNSCPILTTSLKESVTDLSDSLAKIVDYEEANTLPDERFIQLKRRYTLDNIRYWLLAEQAKKECEMDFTSILYFYNEDCANCPEQGVVLSYYKAILGDTLLVFPIDEELRDDEPLVEILLSLYNVTEFPSIIIDNQIYSGFVDKNQVKELICEETPESSICEV